MTNDADKAEMGQMDPDDEILAALLAEGWTHRRVASFCDVSTKTIQRRMQDLVFSEEVSRRKRERLTSVTLRLTRITDKALDVMEDAMNDEDVQVRMRAAKSALDYQERYHRRAVFEADVDHRISALEQGVGDFYGDGDPPSAGDPSIKSLEQVVVELAASSSIENVRECDDVD